MVETVAVDPEPGDQSRPSAEQLQPGKLAADEGAEVEAPAGCRLVERRALVALLPELQTADQGLQRASERDLARQAPAENQRIRLAVIGQTDGRVRVEEAYALRDAV